MASIRLSGASKLVTPEREGSRDLTYVIVTGATGAIGKAIAKKLAAIPRYDITVTSRDLVKGDRAVKEIIQETGNSNVHSEMVDLARLASIREFSQRWKGPLDVLVNNAAASPPNRIETPEGIEMQFAANVLGYYWMSIAFLPYLQSAAPSRIVNVASYYAGDLDINDLEFKIRRYDNRLAYRQSKQANRMLTVAFAERLRKYNIAVNSCHPGDVNSSLSNDLGFGGHESPDQGAETPVWLSTSPVGQATTGKFFERKAQATCRFSANSDLIERLYIRCQDYSSGLNTL